MSTDYYQQLWKDTQDDLKKNLYLDLKIKKKGPSKDLETAKWLIGHLFMNYTRIVNKLDECYDQMLHPQKREVIGRLLDMSLGRLLELKTEIVRIEFDDYCFFDNVLIELKLTHQDMEINVPKYFCRDREKAKEHRRQLIKQIFDEAERETFKMEYLKNVPEEEKEEVWERFLAQEEHERLEKEKFEEQQRKLFGQSVKVQDSIEKLKKQVKENEDEREGESDKELIEQAILVIQRHERARQGRYKAAVVKQNKMIKLIGENKAPPSEEETNKAATVIQKHWRRYKKRVEEANKQTRLVEFLGMIQPSFKDKTNFKNVYKVAMIRRKMQERNQREYDEAQDVIKEEVTKLYSIRMEEDTTDEIRGWFQWFFDKTTYLPNFPPEKPVIPTGQILGIPKKLGQNFIAKTFPQNANTKNPGKKRKSLTMSLAGLTPIGGSALITAGHWISPQEFLICQKEMDRLKKAGKGAGGNKESGMSKEEKLELKKKQKAEEKRRQLAEESLAFQLKDSDFIEALNKADRDYRMTWMDLDESRNYEQRFIYDFVKDEKCWELSMEVRTIVDEMMRVELDILKMAREKDKNPKKKQKKKKPKKGKVKKGKTKKDPTGDRTLDDLFIELFKNGIIREYEEARLKDYLGERSYGAFDFRQKGVDWPPSSGDVRELILQLCILPLGSWRIHQLGTLIKSVCLMGTENSGKEFLARIICTETAAVMFDLSPENVAGKYPGKDGLKMLQHLIEKMSRALQPSVIFVDGAEKTFYKKVPKEEKSTDPKRMAKILQKLVKGIKPADQVLVLGVCSRPWMAKKKKLLKTYQKLIFLPQMDYGSYSRIWHTLLIPYHSMPRNFDVSCLAKTSDGFSVKAIMDAIKDVLTVQRICKSFYQPYDQKEFLEELIKTEPTDEKMKNKCIKFYAGTALPKKRAKRLKEMKEEKEKAKKKT